MTSEEVRPDSRQDAAGLQVKSQFVPDSNPPITALNLAPLTAL